MAEDIDAIVTRLTVALKSSFPGPSSQAALDRVAARATEAARNAEPDPALTKLSLQAEYAVGKGLIAQTDLDALRNRYTAQGDLSLGLLLPFLLLVFACLVELPGVRAYGLTLLPVILVSGTLFFLAIERRSQYRTELRLLLLGRIQKQLDADKAAKEAKEDAKKDAAKKDAPDAITKAVQDAIAKLKLEVKPLVVQVQTEQPPAKKVDAPAAAPGGAATPSTPPASPKTPPIGQAE
jgi:hypothetical protein